MRAVWLVADLDRRLSEFAEDIEPTLPGLYESEGVAPIGPLRWRFEHDEDGQCWLVLDVATRPTH